MGCCASNYAASKANLTLNDTYMPSSERRSVKRNYSSRISSGSSGISSRCTTPSRRSIWSRSSSTASTRTCTPKPKTSNLNLNLRSQSQQDVPKALEMHSICDDFCDAPQLPHSQRQLHHLDKSFGYFSESMSTYNKSSSSALSSTSGLIHTMDTSDRAATPSFGNELEMEMYMMMQLKHCMTKTSSPFCQRRDVTFDMPLSAAAPPSASYEKWRNFLQRTPPYILHNVTDIPEAMAGLFSPMHFHSYIDLDDMESAPKRYKVDFEAECETYATAQGPTPTVALTHTISTEL